MTEALRILDIGCGRGHKLVWLGKRGLVTGIDVDETALTEARRSYPHVEFINMACEDLRFPTANFDEIHCYDVLEHVSDLDKSMKEITRVLKPGGRLVVEVPYWRSEERLLRLRPNYFSEIGHQRMFRHGDIESLGNYGLQLKKVRRKHFIVNIELGWLFRKNIHVANQQGGYSAGVPVWLKVLFMLFNENIFQTPVKYLAPIWIFTLPVGMLLSQWFPKTIHAEFVRSNP